MQVPQAAHASLDDGWRGAVRKVVGSPIAGIAPWIVMSILSGVTTFEIAVGLALATSVVFVIANRLIGGSLKLLEIADVVFFVALVIVGALASARVTDWLETWAGELSNVALVVIAVGSMLVRRPFTLEYAREEVSPALWNNPVFIRTNYVITGFWAGAFVVAAISGFIGDAILDDSNNIWTGWIIQTGAMIVAIQFTIWYPKVAKAKSLQAAGKPTDPPPPLSELFIALAAYIPIVGILSLSFDAAPDWVGIALIVGGVLLAHRTAEDLGKFREARRERLAPRPVRVADARRHPLRGCPIRDRPGPPNLHPAGRRRACSDDSTGSAPGRYASSSTRLVDGGAAPAASVVPTSRQRASTGAASAAMTASVVVMIANSSCRFISVMAWMSAAAKWVPSGPVRSQAAVASATTHVSNPRLPAMRAVVSTQ